VAASTTSVISAPAPGPTRPGAVPAWALKLTAIAAVANVFFLGFGYARANVKAGAAPLQPPVVPESGIRTTPTATPSPAPALNLRRGVRTTPSSPITTTRHS
jgi:hypothetical protein